MRRFFCFCFHNLSPFFFRGHIHTMIPQPYCYLGGNYTFYLLKHSIYDDNRTDYTVFRCPSEQLRSLCVFCKLSMSLQCHTPLTCQQTTQQKKSRGIKSPALQNRNYRSQLSLLMSGALNLFSIGSASCSIRASMPIPSLLFVSSSCQAKSKAGSMIASLRTVTKVE